MKGRIVRSRPLVLSGVLVMAGAAGLAGVAAGAAGAAPAAQRAASHPAAGHAVPAAAAGRWCDTGSLGLRIHPLNPGAGQRYAAAVLTNTSARPCVTRGYVGLRLLGPGSTPVPTDVVRDRSETPRRIVLEPGAKAWARLHWGAVPSRGEPGDRDCQPTANRVRLTPPDTRRQLETGWRYGPVCAQGRIDVLPLAKGSGPVY